MTVFVLILLSAILIAASFVYLTHKDLGGKGAEGLKRCIGMHKGLSAYLGACFVLMCALSVVLEKVYVANTLVANMKVITLLGLLVTVAVTDFKEHIIPNMVILAGIILRMVFAIAELFTLGSGYFAILKSDAISVLLAVVLFVFGTLIVKNGIGMGDIKLVFVMGLFQGIVGVISSLFLSLLVSFFVAIALLITRKKTRKEAIAFAPSVLIGTAVSMFLTGM